MMFVGKRDGNDLESAAGKWDWILLDSWKMMTRLWHTAGFHQEDGLQTLLHWRQLLFSQLSLNLECCSGSVEGTAPKLLLAVKQWVCQQITESELPLQSLSLASLFQIIFKNGVSFIATRTPWSWMKYLWECGEYNSAKALWILLS